MAGSPLTPGPVMLSTVFAAAAKSVGVLRTEPKTRMSRRAEPKGPIITCAFSVQKKNNERMDFYMGGGTELRPEASG